MICPPCSQQQHDDCEDRDRERHFRMWLQSKPDGIGSESRPIGPEEKRIIDVNRPYPSCPCQHKVVAKPSESRLPG